MPTQMTPDEQKQFEAMRDEPAPSPAPESAKPAAAAEPAPAAPTAPAPAEPAKPALDVAALYDERERRRVAQHERDVALAHARELEARLEPKEPEPPAFETDPAGYLKANTDKLLKAQEEERQRRAEEQRMGAVQQIGNRAAQLEREFAAANPDYGQALEHLNKARSEEILEAFPDATPQQVQQFIQKDLNDTLMLAVQTGRNPAELLYKFAKRRGWAPKAAEPVPAAPNGAETIERITAGQEQATGLGAAKGGAPPATGVEAALKMSDAEFAEAFSGKKGEAAWRKIAGA